MKIQIILQRPDCQSTDIKKNGKKTSKKQNYLCKTCGRQFILKPKQTHYDCLEVDEFWTYVGNKKNRKWLIYAYHRATG